MFEKRDHNRHLAITEQDAAYVLSRPRLFMNCLWHVILRLRMKERRVHCL